VRSPDGAKALGRIARGWRVRAHIERCEGLMAEVLKATAEPMTAREAAARMAGELAALQARPWWRRLAG
jgi:hypothetical protein